MNLTMNVIDYNKSFIYAIAKSFPLNTKEDSWAFGTAKDSTFYKIWNLPECAYSSKTLLKLNQQLSNIKKLNNN